MFSFSELARKLNEIRVPKFNTLYIKFQRDSFITRSSLVHQGLRRVLIKYVNFNMILILENFVEF